MADHWAAVMHRSSLRSAVQRRTKEENLRPTLTFSGFKLLFFFFSLLSPAFKSSRQATLTMSADSVKLSKNLLRMKFMQRGLDAETKKQLREDEKRIISDEHWYLDLPKQSTRKNLLVEEKSAVPLEGLLYGRMSFQGFNPEVERLMALMNPRPAGKAAVHADADAGRMQTDVTDEEMALRYESLVGSLKKKFARKREPSAVRDHLHENALEENAKKKMFRKPCD
ncbi:M-phase phosphoprotein 6 [Festucalex cinctus]